MHRRIVKSLSALLALILSLPILVYPQSKDPGPLSVKLNVSVIDSTDLVLTKLTKDQFRVFEDRVPQVISIFERKDRPLVFGLAIDATGSMRRQLNRVIAIAKLFAVDVRPDESMFVLKFVSSDKIRLMQEFTSQTAALERSLEEIFSEGGPSAVIDAVYEANEYVTKQTQGGSSTRRALVLITDGEDRASRYKEEELFAKLQESGLQVFIIALAGDLQSNPSKPENFMKRLTQKTGGNLYHADAATEAQPVVSAIMLELRATYLLGYNSSNPARDGKPRKIRVEVANQSADAKLSIKVRQSYSPPKN